MRYNIVCIITVATMGFAVAPAKCQTQPGNKRPAATTKSVSPAVASPPAAPQPAPPRDLNTPREFPKITTPTQWKDRAREIREQILVDSGLWPMPEKTPLHAVISDKLLRDGYSVERVYLQPLPGFYLAGNLYRPLHHGDGPFPAVLNPHGHWEAGRLADTVDGSVQARCISFARQGMVAFSYDMVGYNDTHFPESPRNAPFYETHRNFATNDPTAQLWSVSLMGLQTWNSIRALDFLESLPDVDKQRLACTGASGGGTQTFMLGAIDDRLAAQAPVVMVSHTMQGGCGCENMPGLRVEFSNMEIAAAAAPRPQILVGATGDWTKTMTNVEGPAVAHIYQLLSAPEKLRYVEFDFKHNYNQTSREAVYQWFDRLLLGQPDVPVKEAPYSGDADDDLRVFANGKLPPDALSQKELIQSMIRGHQSQLAEMAPTNSFTLDAYLKVMKPAWERTLQLEWPRNSVHTIVTGVEISPTGPVEELEMKWPGESSSMKLLHLSPAKRDPKRPATLVVLVHPAGHKIFFDEAGSPGVLAGALLDRGCDLLFVTEFPKKDTRAQLSPFFSTYNRTRLQERVRDVIAACQGLESGTVKWSKIVLCGSGEAGLWCLLAAPAANAVVADCARLDVANDRALLADNLFCPGLRNLDTFAAAPILAAPHPLLVHNTGNGFPTGRIKGAYTATGDGGKFHDSDKRLGDAALAKWILDLK
jgi:hypothetical protein